ncbi:amphi-Trp domain-containing protein [Thermosulfurimonas sp. F29]|uniref:amphi-Trp domain-containing protein n=1 Tax=Thermosulfurimonas sp. F29 TaxID=2867247 RepID=UPI001C83D6C1|nr:amphi-Trp domain-containing protein [Thermosulfurimonas sp. F29]MBX6422247.1 amphi-Trp domain-containing protein [Thermosulfurimonas sp. F29]
MSEKKVLFKSEEPRTREEVATFFRELADRVASGTVTLKRDSQETTLTLPENLILEIKAETKTKPGKTKYALEVEIEWREGEKEGA